MRLLALKNSCPALIILLVFTGCVGIETTRVSDAPQDLTPLTTDEVSVYQDSSTVPCPFRRVARVNTEGDGTGFVGTDRLVNKAKEKAAEIGANGLITSNFDKPDWPFSKPTARMLAISEERPCEKPPMK